MYINKNFKFYQKKTDLEKLIKFSAADVKCCNFNNRTSSTQPKQTNNDNPFNKYKKKLKTIRKGDLL